MVRLNADVGLWGRVLGWTQDLVQNVENGGRSKAGCSLARNIHFKKIIITASSLPKNWDKAS